MGYRGVTGRAGGRGAIAIAATLLSLLAPRLPAQEQPAQEHRAQEQRAAAPDPVLELPLRGAPSAISPLELFLPTAVRAGYLTRAWVRDSLPPAGDSLDDLARMDMIYLRALGEAEGDIETALFAALIASFEHRTVPFSFGLELPLTMEPREKFDRRVAALPRHLFLDQPYGDDKDKLQHFFASAWLAWSADNSTLADLAGLWVESGEAWFIRGGADDHRDVRTNRLGHLYVELLRRHPRALPSALFRAWNREYHRRAMQRTAQP